MSTLKVTLKEALKDVTAGPRPIHISRFQRDNEKGAQEDFNKPKKKTTISLDEYRKRQAQKPMKDVLKTPSTTTKKEKTRGGKLIKIRKELANLHFLANISKGPEREAFIKQINKIKAARKSYIKTKNKNKKQ